MLVISTWPEFDRVNFDQQFDASQLRDIDNKLAHLPHLPAIVLFHFAPQSIVDLEPAYNPEVTWPDDAQIILPPRSRRRESRAF